MVSPLIERLTTCVVGGGNSAHVLVPFLSEARHSVNLLTRRPQDWNHDSITCQLTDGTTGQVAATHVGMLAACSANPADVVPNADIVILCMPVHSYREALDRIAPYLSRSKSHVYVGTMYGQAGFNWMVHAMEREFGLTNIVAFACGSIPWVCRYVNLFMRPAMALTSKDLLASQHNLFVDSTVKYGELVANYGGKHVNVAAVTPHSQFDKLNRVLLQNLSVRPLGMGAFRQAESFLSLTLSVDNQIIHPARCYGLWKKYGGYWKDEAHVPYFYRDFDHTSETILQALDRDYAAVRSAVRRSFPSKQFPYMLDYFSLEKLNHNSSHAGILATFRDSPQLVCIKTPTVPSGSGSQNQSAARVLDTNCRFFTDDIPYGLLVAKRLAELLEQPVPMIDEVLLWAQTLRGEHFVHEKDGSVDLEFCLQRQGKLAVCGIPETYGITKIEDMLY